MSMTKPIQNVTEKSNKSADVEKNSSGEKPREKEIGGFADQNLQEPTRYGDWEVRGRCSDF